MRGRCGSCRGRCGEPDSSLSSPHSESTFIASGAGFGRSGGACTVGVVEWRLEWGRQEDAIRDGTGLARSRRRLRLGPTGCSRGREVAVRLPGSRQLHLTWLAATSLRLLVFVLISRVGDELGGVERVRGGDLRFQVGGVSLRGGRGRVSRVVGGRRCRGLVVPGQRGPIQTGQLVRR